jgi:PAS domain S-box-containing protein
VVPLLLLEIAALQLAFQPEISNSWQIMVDAVLTAGEIALGWWCYHNRAGGARQLNDPRSATLFLLLVPGVIVGGFAALHVLNWQGWVDVADFGSHLLNQWIGGALSIVALAPPLLVIGTPWVLHYNLVDQEPAERSQAIHPRLLWTTGDVLETVGLALGAAILGRTLAVLHAQSLSTNWYIWGVLLLVIVWASLRLGLRGGTAAAAAASVAGLLVDASVAPDSSLLTPLRGNLLAQCCAALLVGASADWIRASEARYRQVVGHIPVLLYSARFISKTGGGGTPEVEIVLVSPAASLILDCHQDNLLGSFQHWIEHVHQADRELLQAAIAQLLLQKQPVTCEYRLAGRSQDQPQNVEDGVPRSAVNVLYHLNRNSNAMTQRWVRDTLAPHYSADGSLNGWEGVVEDITEQRALAHDLRRTTNMLHALVAHLPTGVYFVHGTHGQPLLVNARARQLLGQREDLAAGLSHLPTLYRLHRSDGTPYPWEELPVCTALRQGATSMRDDIVVHRPDGRRIPLVTWAAPVNLGGQSRPDAAVWVLEDLTALRQAEAARHETELRLRAVIETMAEGLIVQGPTGAVAECNPAACAILGVDADQLRTRSSLGPDGVCLREDGSPFPRDEQPDRISLRTGQPVRGVVMGIVPCASSPPAVRWILANTMPLLSTDRPGEKRGQRVVTTFTDITVQRKALSVVRDSEEQYRELVESLPLMLLQFNANGSLTYHNPAAEGMTGFNSDELRAPNFWESHVHSDDWAGLSAALEAGQAGQCARAEFRFRAANGSERACYALSQPRRPAGSTVLVVDITQRRQMEQELQKVQRLELVARIANGVVHDFNNLLTVICSYADLVKDAVGDHHARADLDRISEATDQAARLAGQLLTFSKQRHVVMKRIDLNGTVRRALELLATTMPFTIDIAVRTGAEPMWIMADDAPLQQVVMNLCFNARDAMPKGGRLQVETSPEILEAGDARVATAPGASGGVRTWVRLTIQDTGCGMDETVRSRIFEPLFTTKEHGSGLGLAVVHQIVQGLGGCILVASVPGQGARFDVWFPTP